MTNHIVEQTFIPILEGRNLPFLRGQDGEVILTIARPDQQPGSLLVIATGDDELVEVVMYTPLCRVGRQARAAVALELAALNALFKGVTFAMTPDGDVAMHAFIELDNVRDSEAAISLALARLVHAVEKTFTRIIQAAEGNGKGAKHQRSKMEKEINQILSQFES